MSQCSLSCQILFDYLKKHSDSFKKSIEKTGKNKIAVILTENSKDFMVVKTPEEFQEIEKYGLANKPTEYPFELPFIPAVPLCCDLIESLLLKAIEFSGNSNNEIASFLLTNFLLSCASKLTSLASNNYNFQTYAIFISTCFSFPKCLPYFENLISKSSFGKFSTPDKIKIKSSFNKAAKEIENLLNKFFEDFINQMIDVFSFKLMGTDEPPHSFSMEIVMFLESKSIYLESVLDCSIFSSLIEKICNSLANRINEILCSKSIQWTPQLIYSASQNIQYIAGWSILVSYPSSKAKIIDISKMLSLLVSNQFLELTSDKQFFTKHKDFPFNTMKSILMNYYPTHYKNLYVIPNNLVQNLISQIDKQKKK